MGRRNAGPRISKPFRKLLFGVGIFLVVLGHDVPGRAVPVVPRSAPLLPPAGQMIHGVYPGGVTGEEDDLTEADVLSYEAAVGKKIAWVYFSHNWYHGRVFPLETATWIRNLGAVPYIRLMLRSTAAEYRRERRFGLRRILSGALDEDLKAWGRGARDFGEPLIVEYGTECNGDWFPWNGRWNGAGRLRWGDRTKADGPERFAAAFRHIVALMRGEGADNITWVFHVNGSDWPEKDWNAFENYYPGDDVVDWLAVSVYGPQSPLDDEMEGFRDVMDACYPRLQALAPTKPVIVAEFGCTAGNPLITPDQWVAPTLTDLFAGRWANVIGFSWWNERWENDNNPAHDTTMRVQDTPALAHLFQTLLEANKDKIVQRPWP